MRTFLKTIPLALAALIFVAAPAGATEDPPETPDPISEVLTSENITVTITPDDPQPKDLDGKDLCVDPATASLRLKQAGVGTNDGKFTLKFSTPDRWCTALKVTAAVYKMPGNGEAWPQTLTETLEFRIKAAGKYEVSFDLAAQCSQFDVINGNDTPEIIAPIGEWHGPLLFPSDVNTSFQNWDGCPSAPPVTTPATTVPAPEAPAPAPAAAELAFTGSRDNLFWVGMGLILLGLILLSR